MNPRAVFRLVPVASAALSVLLLSACWGSGIPREARPLPEPPRAPGVGEHAIVAVVNEEVITRRDLDQYLSLEAAWLALAQQYSGEELERRQAEFRKEYLGHLVQERLFAQIARKQGLSLDPDDRELLRRRMEAWIAPYGSTDRLDQELARNGMTTRDLERQETDRILIGKLEARQVSQGDWIGPQEVRAFYDGLEAFMAAGGRPADYPPLAEAQDLGLQWNDRLTLPSSFRFRQIRFDKSGKTSGDLTALKQAVEEALAAGETFEQVARTLSEGPRAAEGGLWEVGSPDDLVPELAQRLRNLSAGQVVGPVETDRYVFFAEVEDRQGAAIRPYGEVQGVLRDLLRVGKLAHRLDEWRQEELARAYIQRFDLP